MTRARLPDALTDPVEEAAIARMWQGIRRRRGVYDARAMFKAGVLAFAVVLIVAGGVSWLFSPRGEAATSATPRAPTEPVARSAALTRSDGRPLSTVEVKAEARSRPLALSDGSRLVMEPGSLWEPLAESSSVLVSALRRGAVTFEIEPGGARRWTIEVGPVTVEVIGTRFRVARVAEAVEVWVTRGEVLVRGAPVPDGVQRLTAGQRLEVTLVQGPEAAAPAPSASARHTPTRPSSSRGWLDRARTGDYAIAYAELGENGVQDEARRTRSLSELMALADVARLSGHPAAAVAPLEEIGKHHSGSPKAAVAAMTLGRLLLGQLGRPAQAARALERALALSLPATLRQDAYARLAEAYAKAGDRPRARATLSRYLREFPDGQRRGTLEQWLESE